MTSNFNYDFGMVFDRFNTNHDSKLDPEEAKIAKEAGYVAEAGMSKSIFEEQNNSSPDAKQAYVKDFFQSYLDNVNENEIFKTLDEIIKKLNKPSTEE